MSKEGRLGVEVGIDRAGGALLAKFQAGMRGITRATAMGGACASGGWCSVMAITQWAGAMIGWATGELSGG